ncbi:MAG: hypothetical protein LUG93_11320 [Lachnospiraceae bacterium]|nr:hypothetical protein [Lachnospiraceae bacterium]
MFCESQGKVEEAFLWQERSADSLETFYQNQMSELADLLQEDEEALAEMEDLIWFELSECYESSIERYERWDKKEEALAWKHRWAEMKEQRLPFARPGDEEDWDWFSGDDPGSEKVRDWFSGDDPDSEEVRDWDKISDEDFGTYAGCADYSPELLAYLAERIAKLEERYAQTQELELRYSISELYSAMRSLLTDGHYLEMEQHEREVEELQREVQESTKLWLESFDAVLEINEEYSGCRKKAAEGGADASLWQKKAEDLAEKSEAERKRSDEYRQRMEDAEQRMDAEQLARVESEWEQKVRRYDEQKAMWKEKIRQWDARTLELLLEYVTLVDQEYAKAPSEESETKRIEVYRRIARMFEQKHDLENAALWYRKELSLLEERFSQTHAIQHYDEIADACHSIGMLDAEHPDVAMLRRALKIYKEVDQYMPEMYQAELMEELERLCAENG